MASTLNCVVNETFQIDIMDTMLTACLSIYIIYKHDISELFDLLCANESWLRVKRLTLK